MKKLLWILLIVFGAALFAFALGYALSYRIEAPRLPSDAALVLPDSGATVGARAKIIFEAELPLRCRPDLITAELSDKVVVSGAPEITLTGYFYTRARYRIALDCVLLAAGEVPEGRIELGLRPPLREKSYAVALAPFTIKKAPSTVELALADTLEAEAASRAAYYLLTAIAVLALLTILAAALDAAPFLRPSPPPTVQELALLAIINLRLALAERRTTSELAFGKLSNVVRLYLERRFGIPASRSTTEEFFDRVARERGLIPSEERPFLEEFFVAADMVKFAKAEADPDSLNNAFRRAEELVEATTPHEEEKEAQK